MGKSDHLRVGVRWVVPLILAIALTMGWGVIAYAQTPTEGQYASPTATAAGNPAAAGNDPAAVMTVTGAATGGGGAGSSGGGTSGGVLPSTGGPLPVLIALGVLAAGSTGLLALRRSDRR
jgi:hypothetical protein